MKGPVVLISQSLLRRSMLASLAICVCFACIARGDVLIRQTFDDAAGDKLPTGKQPLGTLGKYEGSPDGPLGTIDLAKIDGPKGTTTAARISNVLHKDNRAPALNLRWAQPAAGVVRIEYQFMTPIDGPFLSVHYFGGDWKTGAAILLISNGKIALQYGVKDARMDLGTYVAKEWQSVRLDFDVAAKTVDVYLNDKKRANRLPWQATAVGIARADLFADFKSTDHAGTAVLYIDDITVQTVTPAK